jgi:hypothetical protein
VNDNVFEGVAIARLIGMDGQTLIGWVYRWDTGSLAIRWGANGPQRVLRCEPELTEAQKQEIDFDGLSRI